MLASPNRFVQTQLHPSLYWQRRGWFSTIAPAISQFYLGGRIHRIERHPLKSTTMSVEEEACIVAASYQPSGSQTVIELWLRAREGHSTLLLVHGLRPFFEIALPGKTNNLPDDLDERLSIVREVKDVMRIYNPVEKWTDLGSKLHWKVEVRQPFNVPKIRDTVKARGWEVSSADIVFPQRLLLFFKGIKMFGFWLWNLFYF